MRLSCLLAAALVAAAGCAGPPADPEQPDAVADPAPESMHIRGAVQDDAFQMVAGANVTLIERDLTVVTAPDGTFSFGDMPLGFYRVEAGATDLLPQTLTLQPGHDRSLLFTLARFAERPSFESVRYAGTWDCAAEYLIIPGSCDLLLEDLANRTGAPIPDVFSGHNIFEHPVHGNWRTVVVDVIFDPDAMPLLDGLRVTVRGLNDADVLGTYEQNGRFHASQPFTFALEPGQTYTGGDQPIPFNATVLEFSVYPQGHGYYATCAAMCLLGVGAGTDVSFELLVTTFYVEPAPAGFTLQ